MRGSRQIGAGDELVIAGGDGADVLEPAEGVLDQTALAVPRPVVGDFCLRVILPRITGTAPAWRSVRRGVSTSDAARSSSNFSQTAYETTA